MDRSRELPEGGRASSVSCVTLPCDQVPRYATPSCQPVDVTSQCCLRRLAVDRRPADRGPCPGAGDAHAAAPSTAGPTDRGAGCVRACRPRSHHRAVRRPPPARDRRPPRRGHSRPYGLLSTGRDGRAGCGRDHHRHRAPCGQPRGIRARGRPRFRADPRRRVGRGALGCADPAPAAAAGVRGRARSAAAGVECPGRRDPR